MRIPFFYGSLISFAIAHPSMFPKIWESIITVADEKYQITEYLGAGHNKQAFVGKLLSRSIEGSTNQEYRIPRGGGVRYEGLTLPSEIVVKCLAAKDPTRFDKLESEFRRLTFLNRITTINKPTGYFLSDKWRCGEELRHVCQYLVMTRAGPDVHKVISKKMHGIKPVLLDDAPLRERRGDKYSFEVWLITMGLTLIDELEALHKAGVVHGDVRTLNVALDPVDRSKVFLIDFGSAKFLRHASDSARDENLKLADFNRVKSVMQKLIIDSVRENHGRDDQCEQSKLYRELESAQSGTHLKSLLHSLLQNEFPQALYQGKIIYM